VALVGAEAQADKVAPEEIVPQAQPADRVVLEETVPQAQPVDRVATPTQPVVLVGTPHPVRLAAMLKAAMPMQPAAMQVQVPRQTKPKAKVNNRPQARRSRRARRPIRRPPVVIKVKVRRHHSSQTAVLSNAKQQTPIANQRKGSFLSIF